MWYSAGTVRMITPVKPGYVLRAGRGVSARTSAVTFEGIGSFHISGNAGHGPPRIPLRAVLHVSGNAGHGPPRRPLRTVLHVSGNGGHVWYVCTGLICARILYLRGCSARN